MKVLLILSALLLSFSSLAAGYDLSRRFGISASTGWSKPILGNDFDDRADGGAVYGLYASYHVNDQSGLQLGYTRYDWTHSPTAIRVYDLMYTHRPLSDNRLTPLWGIGAGLVDIANYNVDENLKLGLRLRAGLEYAISPDLLLAGIVDFQYVNKMIGEDDNLTIGEIYALAPQLMLSFFFSK